MMGPKRLASGAAVILATILAACSPASDGTTAPATLDAFVSDAPLLAGLEPDFERSKLLDRGEFTIFQADDGDKILAEVAVRDTDDQPMQATATGDDRVLPDGTQVVVREPENSGEVLGIEFADDTGASVKISAFDSDIYELLYIADAADISPDGSLTIASDEYTVVADARLPLYTGGVRSSYSIGVDGTDGSVDITSFARRGGELDVFDFGPHDPATVGSRELLLYDAGDGNGSYVFAWDDDTLIAVDVFLRPGLASSDDIAALIDEVRPAES